MRALSTRRKVEFALIASLALSVAVGIGFGADLARQPAKKVTAGLSVRETTAGPVQIKITPVRIDATGAAFKVALDNHEIDLTMDLAKGASLTVGPPSWAPARWSGDGPSGHHREGTLTFPPGGMADGQAVLTLTGFPAPVRLEWTLPSIGGSS